MFIIKILEETVKIFIEMAPYIMLGLFFVGLLNLFFTKDLIVKHVGKDNFFSVLKAAMLGVPLPLCSCGVIPSTIYMAKNGASKGSVVSFLISTPQTGIDSIIATYGMMGWVFALFRPLAALVMGIVGGTVVRFLNSDKKTQKEEPSFKIDELKPAEAQGKRNIVYRLKKTLHYSFIEFLDDISFQFIIGVFISGLIAYIIPEGFFENSPVNSGILGMLMMIAVGIPMYVCATASIPIAVTLMLKGFSPGVAFVFLVTGPATNAASFSIIIKALGKKVAFTYLAVISISAILFGYLLDWIFHILNIDPLKMLSHMHHEDMLFTDNWKIILSAIFLILILMSLYRKFIANRIHRKDKAMDNVKAHKVNIEGMTCNHCVMNVTKAISQTKGVDSVEVSLGDKAAYVEGNYDFSELKKAVEDIGYKVVG